MTSLHQPRNSFVIRIWWEQAGDSQSIWRGWVQHTRSGEATYVQDLEELLAFIERWAGKLSNPDGPPMWLR
jgi:hypothetical protein